MNAIICDRCGDVFEKCNKRGQRKYTLRKIDDNVKQKQMSRGSELDLCDECYSDLIKWLTVIRPRTVRK